MSTNIYLKAQFQLGLICIEPTPPRFPGMTVAISDVMNRVISGQSEETFSSSDSS